MRTLTFIFALAILSGCKTNKQYTTSALSESQTSASFVRYHFTTEVDSMFRSLSLAFDTLEINIIEPQVYTADSSLRISVKAVNGLIIRDDKSSRHKAQAEILHDTLSTHQTDSLSVTSDTATTRFFSPPNFSICLMVVIFFIFLYIILRSIRNKY